jgi:hypothetical protein
LYGGAKYLWALSMELASRHHTGTQNYELIPGLFDTLGAT